MADVNTKEIDFERAAQLLRVVHDCAGIGPKLTNLGNAAMTELTKMNDAIKVAAQEAEKERRVTEARNQPTVRPNTDPTASEPDEDLLGRVHPSVHPADSQTATIADRRL